MKRFILWLLLVLTSPAWAAPSPKEVSDAVHAGKFALAEQLLQQTLQEKPNSAMAHYELGQVLAKEKRHQEALDELNKAQQLDPALHFAKKPQLFQEIYNAEKSALQRQEFLQSNTRTTPSSVIHPTKSEHQQSGGKSMISYFAVVLLLLGGVLLVIYWWMSRADAQRAKEQQRRLAEQAQEQLALLLQQAETVRDSELECRAASYSAVQKQPINNALAVHREALMQAIAHCKEEMPLSDEQLHHLQAETARLQQAARSGELPAPVSAPAFEPVMQPPQQGGWHDPQPQAPQSVIINNNTSSGGMLGGVGGVVTGVVLGEMLAGNRQHETVVYRDEVVREDPANERSALPDFDGSNDDNSAGWDDDSSSFDGGNDDSWS